MEQKNTIVKCKAHPNCLFNHNGVCDNYVININADGKCECYVETEESIFVGSTCGDCEFFQDNGLLQCPCDKHEQYAYRKAPACDDFRAKRGQRARGNFFEDKMNIDDKHLGEMVTLQMKIAELDKLNKNKSVLQEDQMCWYCDHGKHGKCKFPAKPMRDSNGECCRFTSTGGNR